MVVLRIFPNQKIYQPGDMLRGVLVLKTRKPIECNRVVLSFQGKEKTTRQAGDIRLEEEHYWFKTDLILHDGGTIPEGSTRLPFAIHLSKGIPPTFGSPAGNITYSIKAVMEVSWRPDPKKTWTFAVIPEPLRYIPESQDHEAQIRKSGPLYLDLPSNVVRPEGLPFSMRVDQTKRVTELRVLLRRRESFECQGSTTKIETTEKEMCVPVRVDDFGRWKEYSLPKHIKVNAPFRGRLIRREYYLRVELGVSLARDPVIEVPVLISAADSRETISEEQSMFELLDDIAHDLELE
ncbi:MAG: hypothetical protein DRP09_12450 [Candidatus Thorarchaeota archaeon]|nr:MAG: hypothetical protein DRP09_12450 [Candidatus Thorarchaeota archaeon]